MRTMSTTRLRHLMLTTSASMLLLAGGAHAQDVNTLDVEDEDVVIATGTIQRTIEQSLQAKRRTTVVSDALIGAEIGDLPDLSIAESLERITGVTSDRFKGGASELSIRGLGAFLGSSLLNGREITSGSDGRDVNFGQFPSELIGGTQVFKSQQADFVEGGISGIIELQTLRPLDYGKRRIQVQGLAGYSDYEDRVDGGQPISSRITGSYTDQFETGAGDIGIAIGGQLRRDTAPEDIYTSSSTYRPCTSVEGEQRSNGSNQSNNCRYNESDGTLSGPSETYFISNQYILRAQETDADRDAIMGNIQWRPNDSWDFNLDAQWSDRRDEEIRHNLAIADGRRDIAPIEISETGALLAWTGETRLENQSVLRNRDEQYVGLGLSAEWQSDRVSVTGDVGYSKTERRQDELDMRIRTNPRYTFTADLRDTTVPSIEFDGVTTENLNDHDFYTNGARARRRLENVDDELLSFRLDSVIETTGSVVKSYKVGARYAERTRVSDDGIDQTISGLSGYDSEGAIAARRDVFPVADLFDGEDNTNLQGITWATWNPEALFVGLTGDRDAGLPTGSTLDFNDANISEDTLAFYGMAEFEGNLLDLPAYGNVGVRAVYTDIESSGVQNALTAVTTPDGVRFVALPADGSAINVESNDFWNFLPSANLVFELRENQLLRFAAYRAMARPDPGDLSSGLRITQDDDGLASLDGNVFANGNPFIKPLVANNFDISYEWYKDDDTAFSAAFYYKKLETGFENRVDTISLDVDGVATPVSLQRSVNNDESSSLTGLELSLTHKFSYLPGPLSGFGFQAGYNYAASDFEFPDPVSVGGVALADLTEPANISGYSKHSGNISGYWENDDISLRLAYKARSPYFKPFRTTQNRYTNPQEFIDFSASYDLTDNFELRFQALNLTDEPNLFYRPTRDSLAQADYSGRRFFFGGRAKF